MRATRDDSGWNTDEPVPTRATARSSVVKLGATDRKSSPTRVEPMPMARLNGSGWRSVYNPTAGWSSEADSWKVRVIRPIWVKLSWKLSLSRG